MTGSTWRGVLGGGLAMLLMAAPAMLARAETTPPAATQPGVAKPAAKPGSKHAAAASKTKPKAVKDAAAHEPAHAAKKLAATKAKPSDKPLAEAKKKPEPAKKIEVAKKTEPPKSEPTKVAADAPPSELPSYTITSTHNGVTTTTTRIVPLTPTPTVTASAQPLTPAPPPASPPATNIAAIAPAAEPSAKPPEIKPAEGKPQAPPATQVAAVTPAETKPPQIKPAVASTPPKPVVTPVSLTQPAEPTKPASFAAVAAASFAALPDKRPPLASAQPADPKAAATFVSGFLSEAFRIAKSDGTSLQRRARLAELFAGHMDVKRIAGYTTGDELSGASSDVQQRFRTILVSYLVETYYPQLELAADPSVTVDTAPVNPLPDGTAVVWTTFTKGTFGSQSVKWHVVNEDGHYRIVDIFSAGASLVQMERDTFFSVMRDGGLNKLMVKLDARTKELASAATE